MTYIVVDIESDGPIPHLYSMVCFGAVIVDSKLDKTFYGQVHPVGTNYIEEALAISGFTREQHEGFDSPDTVMYKFADWIENYSDSRPVFISDNPAFDWQWINYYFHRFYHENPFGFSARRIGDLYCGMKMDAGKNSEWKKKLRKTRHSHHPVQDCLGNAEALLEMKDMGLKIKF